MNTKKRIGLVLGLAVVLLAVFLITGGPFIAHHFLGLPEFTHDRGRHENMPVAMRDGVKLNTDIYFPEGDGPWPVVLIRSPYNLLNGMNLLARMFAGYGYVGVHQDVRGSFRSEGKWFPVVHERDDGADTLELTRQTWQNGHIALFGASYFGYTQLAVADILPPEVKTIIPMIISTDIRNMVSENGMFLTDLWTGWPALMHDGNVHPLNGKKFQRALSHLPPEEADITCFGRRIDWFREIVSGVDAASALQQRELAKISAGIPGKIRVPVLMVSGWYDLFTAAQIRDFQRLASKNSSRIIIGPWAHLLGIRGDGDKDFPGAGTIVGQMPRILNWLDHYLRGGPLADWGPVESYAIGEGKWEQYPAWPPETKAVRYYPAETAGAHTCGGGKLARQPATRCETIRYVYDPREPVPTTGGHALLMFAIPGFGGAPPSSREQNGLCRRKDVITFISEPLRAPLAIRGIVRAGLTVSSDAEDTCFTAKLVEVDPAGRALNICDGITRLAYRNGTSRAVAYRPGEKVKLTFDMHPVAWTIKPGYRLRLDISSSNFPAYHAHANQAGPWAAQTNPVTAEQTVYIGPTDSTYVELPVLPGEKVEQRPI